MPIIGTIASSTQQGLAVNDFQYLATATADGSSATIEFQNISQAYKHLRIIGMLKTSVQNSNNTRLRWAFNNDTTNSNYYDAYYVWEGHNASIVRGFENDRLVGVATNDTTGQPKNFAMDIVEIMNYVGTQKKGAKFRGGTARAGLAGSYAHYSLLWNNTSAINRVAVSAISGNLMVGSKLFLYGIKGN